MRGSKFEVFKDKKGEFRFHLRASNGEIVLASEGYTQKHNALKGIESVRERAPDAEIVDFCQLLRQKRIWSLSRKHLHHWRK
jgi:uncharacterized protein YegP (UPF0339 family)